ncbi:unnamed protein product, partial [Rotaria sordida]
MEVIGENNDESTSDMPRTQIISDENAMLLNAKVTFR